MKDSEGLEEVYKKDFPVTDKKKIIKPAPAGKYLGGEKVSFQYARQQGICRYCKEPIKWKMARIGNMFKGAPYNSDGSRHNLTCAFLKKI